TTYEVTVTDNNGCTDVDQVTVIVNENPTADAGADEEICFGNSTTITASANGGEAPYTYEWNQGLGAGASHQVSPTVTTTYEVTVTDNNGCTDVDQVTVIVNENPTVSIDGDDATCGYDNGSATAIPSGGESPYTYLWNNNETTATITDLAVGTYTVTVTDNNGCMASTTVVISNIDGATASVNDASVCPGDQATLTVTVSGGTLPFTYLWSTNETSASINVNPLVTTTYYVTVTDGNGCPAIAEGTVTTYPVPVANAGNDDDICFGAQTTLTASASGGTAPYTFVWDNGLGAGASHMVSPATTTTYTVTVTDANGCEDTDQVVITVNENPTVGVQGEDATCGFANGSATATGMGGTAPYTYLWSNGQTNATATNLLADTYDVTVTDANGCTGTNTIVINNISGPSASVPPVSACPGDDAVLTVQVNGGTAPYTYLWETTETTISITVNPMVTTSYSVTVTDANGCEAVASGTVTPYETPIANAGPDTEICFGTSTELTASATNGLAPYTYIWSTGENSAVITVDPDVETTYFVTVTDSRGCVDTDEVVVAINPLPVADASDDITICYGSSTTLTVSAVGGTPPYTYAWSNSATGTSTTVTPLVSTDYFVTVTDSKGCTDIDIVMITVVPNPIVSAEASKPTICVNETTLISASSTSGTPPYTYNWDNGLGAGDSHVVSPVVTTTYSVTVTDFYGCEDVTTITINVNENPIADAGDDVEICLGQSVDLSAAASGGLAPYTFEWDNGLGSGPDKTVIPTATTTYTVTITDANGCEDVDQVTVIINNDLCSKIGDFVWDDTDGDGVQDAGEPGIGGVTVNLLDGNGNFLETTTTLPNGYYEFADLIPGDYIVEFETPTGYEPTLANQGGDDTEDSDAVGGQTGIITLMNGDSDLTNDAGYYRPASLGDFVWS
ncbi:MAG TPA: SdrD B-like domain-containing protein, partial [Saprospiraceae bacterium]|nr:SdrD B-like domain-containing protein [Saprospiraceae bacterium]